jgi:hypothetical protein
MQVINLFVKECQPSIYANLLLFLKYAQERIELSHSQELLSQYSTVQVFEFHDTIYCMLLKTSNRKSQPGFFLLNMDNGRLSFK